MDPTIYNKIKNIFESNNGYARTKEILEANIHSSHLYKLHVYDNLKVGRNQFDYGLSNTVKYNSGLV
jgi:hypothetical protein